MLQFFHLFFLYLPYLPHCLIRTHIWFHICFQIQTGWSTWTSKNPDCFLHFLIFAIRLTMKYSSHLKKLIEKYTIWFKNTVNKKSPDRRRCFFCISLSGNFLFFFATADSFQYSDQFRYIFFYRIIYNRKVYISIFMYNSIPQSFNSSPRNGWICFFKFFCQFLGIFCHLY